MASSSARVRAGPTATSSSPNLPSAEQLRSVAVLIGSDSADRSQGETFMNSGPSDWVLGAGVDTDLTMPTSSTGKLWSCCAGVPTSHAPKSRLPGHRVTAHVGLGPWPDSFHRAP